MRPIHLALLALLLAPAARAGDAPLVELTVGETKALGGSDGRCDDLAVVSVTLGPSAVVKGLKPGTTTCSVAFQGGARRVYTVKVLPADDPALPRKAAPPRPPTGEREG